MPLITIYSPKGGVGKTTLVANLCYSFSRLGFKSIAVDLDPQNALKLHFGLPITDKRGASNNYSDFETWDQYINSEQDNAYVLPYRSKKYEPSKKSEHIHAPDSFLFDELKQLIQQENLIVIVDLPTASEELALALSPLTDVFVIPLLSDTASLAVIPEVELFIKNTSSDICPIPPQVVLNQMDYRCQISIDVETFITNHLKDSVIGIIHKDYSVVEANAKQTSILGANTCSVSASDINSICKKLMDMIKVNVGDGAIHQNNV